ncbi:MAG: UDP-N-acetylmuramoyl-L-alanyl-D-glutamate--2,6-diaminopimelate ligase [Clostridiales bacterium]|nr:UDP-N-acetylmuramoyl-L-alanyl-D-glutamate--2,6-diaminopimelate ligase [Clostridiales bacterium]
MKIGEVIFGVNVLSPVPDVGDVSTVTDRTDKITKGCAFVCIEGKRFDGHSFAGQAIDAGAAVVIVQKDMGLERQIIVDDTRKAYSLMCANLFGRPAEKLKLIGVTGTNGKTTTCFLIKGILDANGEKTGLVGTVKNMIGKDEYPATLTTPDPMELQELFAKMVAAGCTYCVMEVSSQALSQQRVYGMRFEEAIFTNLTREHLDYHGSFENYRDAKHILFTQSKTAIINADDEYAESMVEGTDCKVITFSTKKDSAQYTAKNINLKISGVEYELVAQGIIGRVHFRVPGLFSVYNSMGAAICAVDLGISLKSVLETLAKMTGIPGRMEIVPTDTDYTVIIDYAHTPDALENVIKAIKGASTGRIITVFGCGGDRDKTKRPIMGKIVSEMSDIAIVTSDNPRTEDPDAIIEDIVAGITRSRATVYTVTDRTQAIEKALHKAKANDIVLLAGKGHETYQILKTGKIHYDEREIVADILNKK